MHHPKLRVSTYFLVICLCFVPTLGGQTPPAGNWYVGGPWEQGLFSSDIAGIQKAAEASRLPTAQAVTVFMQEGNANYRTDGSLERRSTIVYRIDSADGLKNWSETELSWSPWYQEAPRLRVRIINPDGKIWSLSEKDLIEVAAGTGDDQIYQDRKTLKAPYPNVGIGSLIEEEIVEVSRPFLTLTGVMDQCSFARRNAIGLNRYIIRYPSANAPQIKAIGMTSVKPVRSEANGWKTETWEIRNQPSANPLEDYVTPETRQNPVVMVSSAPAWETLAERYGNEVDKVLASGPLTMPTDLKLPANDIRTATLKASRWINSRIRYTGLELGNNSIIPFAPRDVLARGYGDCKDKATLLVGLLRAAGYQAWVSLLYTGPGLDIDPGVSTLNNFNHAIIYADDGKGFWFDPTVEFSRTVTLPYQDLYRHTLIARKGQKTLSRTPPGSATENLVRELRDFVMAPDGRGSVTEVTEYAGAYDIYYRNRQLFQDPKKVREGLESYLDGYYGTKKVSKAEWADPADLSEVYRLTVAGTDISRAITGDTAAEISLHLNNLKPMVPDLLLDDKDPKRTQAFRLNMPFSYEMISTIHPPVGFEVRNLPDPLELGGKDFLFRRSWEILKDGSLKGTDYFETRRTQFSAEEFTTLRKDLRDLFEKHNQLTLVFDHRGEILRAEGRYSEAFDSYRAILAAEPDNAIHYRRLSVALQSYSLGQPAVYYARRATELAPDNADMWANLATMLMNDGLGRRLNKGWDRTGAISAWRKAIALAPDNKAHQANLTIALEYNADGARYQDIEDLKLARTEFQGLGEALNEYSMHHNYWSVLIRLGDLETARKQLVSIKDEQLRNIAMVVTEVLGGSTQPAMKLLEQKLPLEKRQNYLVGAVDTLVNIRHYQEAAKLLRQAAVANRNAGSLENRADTLDRIRAIDSPGSDASSPTAVLKRFLFEYLRRNGPTAQVLARYSSSSFKAALPDIGEVAMVTSLDNAVKPFMGQGSPALLADIALSLLNFEVVGEDKLGYRLNVSFDGGSDNALSFYMVKEGAEYRLVSWQPRWSILGRQIMAFLDAGQMDAAVKWFNWVFPPSPGQKPAPLQLRFFSDESLPRNPWLMRQAAAGLVLLDNPKNSSEAIDRLWKDLSDQKLFLAEATRQAIPESLRQDLWNSLAFGLADAATRSFVNDRARQIGGALAAKKPDQTQFVPWYAASKVLWGESAEAESLIEAYQAGKPEDRQAFFELLGIYQYTLNHAKLDAASARNPTWLRAFEYNNLAWNDLFRNPDGTVPPLTLERARKAVNLEQEKNRASLHTLATVYATVGRFDEARSVLAKVIELNPDNEPSADDWYVIGLITAGFGFPEAALEAWRKVTRDADEIPRGTDTWNLAQQRIRQATKTTK